MHLYYIVSGILLVLPIIDFAVAAPVLVQENPQAGLDVVSVPEDAMTSTLWKRTNLDDLFYEIFGDTESHSSPSQGESSTTRPSSPQPSGPADGSTDFEQPPLSSISKEPSQVSSSGTHAPIRPVDGMMKMWLNTITRPESSGSSKSESSIARLSPVSQPLGHTDGSMAVQDTLPSISKETSSSNSAPPSATIGMMRMWLDTIDPKSQSLTKPKRLRPPGSKPLGRPPKKPRPTLPEKPSLVSSSGDRAPLGADDNMMKLWLDIIGQSKKSKKKSSRPEDKSMKTWRNIVSDVKKNSYTKPQVSSVTPPSSSSLPSGPAGESMVIEKALPSMSKKPSQVSSSDRVPPKTSLNVIESESQPSLNPGMLSTSHLSSMSTSEELLQVSSPDRVPPKTSLNVIESEGQSSLNPGMLSTPHPSSMSTAEELSQVSSPHQVQAPPSVGDGYQGLNDMWFN